MGAGFHPAQGLCPCAGTLPLLKIQQRAQTQFTQALENSESLTSFKKEDAMTVHNLLAKLDELKSLAHEIVASVPEDDAAGITKSQVIKLIRLRINRIENEIDSEVETMQENTKC